MHAPVASGFAVPCSAQHLRRAVAAVGRHADWRHVGLQDAGKQGRRGGAAVAAACKPRGADMHRDVRGDCAADAWQIRCIDGSSVFYPARRRSRASVHAMARATSGGVRGEAGRDVARRCGLACAAMTSPLAELGSTERGAGCKRGAALRVVVSVGAGPRRAGPRRASEPEPRRARGHAGVLINECAQVAARILPAATAVA